MAIAAATVKEVADAPQDNVVRGGFATSLFKRYAELPLVSSLGPSRAANPSGHSNAASLPPGPPSSVAPSLGSPPVRSDAPAAVFFPMLAI